MDDLKFICIKCGKDIEISNLKTSMKSPKCKECMNYVYV